MKFDGMKVLLFILSLAAFVGGIIGLLDRRGLSAGSGTLAGGALIALAILHYTDKKKT